MFINFEYREIKYSDCVSAFPPDDIQEDPRKGESRLGPETTREPKAGDSGVR